MMAECNSQMKHEVVPPAQRTDSKVATGRYLAVLPKPGHKGFTGAHHKGGVAIQNLSKVCLKCHTLHAFLLLCTRQILVTPMEFCVAVVSENAVQLPYPFLVQEIMCSAESPSSISLTLDISQTQMEMEDLSLLSA